MNEKDFENYLRENLRLNRENNELLKKINARQLWARAGSMFYGLVILVILAIAAYFIVQNLPKIRQDFSIISSQVSAVSAGAAGAK